MKKMQRNYVRIASMVYYGNWESAVFFAVENRIDGYILLELYDFFKERDIEPITMRKLLILSVRIERKKNDIK